MGFVKFRRNALLSESDRREFSPEFGRWHVATLLFEPTWRAEGLMWVSLGLVHDVGRVELALRWLGPGEP